MVKKALTIIFILFAIISIGITLYNVNSDNTKSESTTVTDQPQSKESKNSDNSSKDDTDTVDEEQAKPKVGVQIGDQAVDIQLPTLDGKTVKLSSYRGKKVILNFWATWCPPCKKEMPDMQKFYEKASHDEVVVLAVNLTMAEKNKLDVSKFVKDYKLTFPILLEETGSVATTYQAQSIPTSYIIDSHGIIQNKHIGPMSEDWMVEQINSID